MSVLVLRRRIASPSTNKEKLKSDSDSAIRFSKIYITYNNYKNKHRSVVTPSSSTNALSMISTSQVKISQAMKGNLFRNYFS